MRNLRKQLFTLALTLVLTLTLLPTSALATVGETITTDAERAAVRTLKTTDFAGRQFMVLQNDYITFAVQSSSGSGNELYSYTAPTALLNGSIKNIFLFPMEITRFRSHDGTSSSWSAGKDLRVTGIKGSNEKDPVVDDPNTCITLELTTSDSRLTATMTFNLERVDLGENDSAAAGGSHWGVLASTRFRLVPPNGGDPWGYYDDTTMAVYQSKEYPLSTMGHQSADAAPLMMHTLENVYANYKLDYTACYTQTLGDVLGLIGTSTSIDTGDRDWISRYHTEICTTSYVCGNPFVALSSYYYGGSHGLTFYPKQVESNGGKVTTYNTFDTLSWVDGQNSDRQDMFWGFRNLYASGDQAAPTEPDKVTVSGDKLYIIPNGDTFRVTTAASNKAVAIVRGSFKLENGAYNFTGGAAALSPTVTATWGSGGYFRIRSDGTIEQKGVNLNAPSFKFYKPKSGADNALKLSFDSTGLNMTFDPSKNEAIFALNIPYATANVEKGTADINGNLTFSGDMSISTLFDGFSFELEKLGYGLKKGSFTVNGVAATGTFNTANLLGLELMEVDGEINTFAGEEKYGFKLELDVFSLFETAAELELKRLKSGELMPNNLYFYFGSEPGIPLVPPVPTTFITGGGAGFYNLADTANGNWFAIPPLKLRGTVSVQFVKLLEADKANIVFGPSVYEVSSEEVKFAKVASIFGGGYGMYLNGDKVTYDGTTYTGLSADGKIWMQVALPDQKWNVLTVDGQMAAGIFGGMNRYDLYMRAYGNSRCEARIQTPTSWGKVLGGKKLAGVGVDAAVVGQTLINGNSKDFDTIVRSAFENMKLQVGLAGTTSFLGSGVRVWAILPDAAQNEKKDTNWGFEYRLLRSLPAWSWDGKLNIPANASTFSTMSLMAADLELYANGEGDIFSQPAATTKTVQAVKGDTDDSAYLVLVFDESVTEEALKESLQVTGPNGTPVSLKWPEIDNDDVITNAADCNAFTDVMPRSDDSGESDRVVVVYLEGADDGEAYNVTTAGTAGQALYAEPELVEEPTEIPDPEASGEPEEVTGETGEVTDEPGEVTGEPEEVTSEPGEVTDEPEEVTGEPEDEPEEIIAESFRKELLFRDAPESALAFRAEAFSVSPMDQLGSVSFESSGSVQGSVEHPETGAKYIVRTYLSTERGGADYLVDERDVENGSFNLTISDRGTAAPSGSYYLTTYLMKEVTYTDDEGEKQTAYIAIGSDSSNSAMFAYTNTNTPDAPADVTLAAAGNETMVASWKAPSDTTNVDGYKITIYEQDKNGEWVDSGYGYEYDTTQFSTMPGLSYDEDAKTYSINMAVTMGGADEKNGTPVTLKADKSYKVGVSAYNSETVEIGDASQGEVRNQNVKYYGPETQSDKAFLPAYTPMEIKLDLYAVGEYGSNPLSADDDGIYNAYINNSNYGLLVNGGSNATFTVTRMDDCTELMKNSDGGYHIPAFEGTLMLEVTGKETDTTYNITNTTTRYVLISRDDTAPIVTLDEDAFYTSAGTRDYTVTGITEPGTAVSMSYSYDKVVTLEDWYGDTYEDIETTQVTVEAIAGADGSFTLTGTLQGDADSVFFAVTAKDAVGNLGHDSALVIVGEDPAPDPDPDPDPRPETPGTSGGGSGSSSHSVSVTASKHGKVTSSPSSARSGSTVTLTVTPDDGYELDTLTVTDSRGNELKLTDKGNGKYAFQMPASKVTVEAAFTAVRTGHDCPSRAFTDLNVTAWYHEAVDFVLTNGMMGGYGNGSFGPNAPLSRAQLCQILYNAEGKPAIGPSSFTDVAADAWCSNAVAWANANGIVTGYGDGYFGPNNPITRQQLATMLWRYARYKGYDVSIGEDTNILSYADAFTVSEYAIPAMQWACGSGVVGGYADKTLRPQNTATRAQVAQMLMRFCELGK